MAKEYRRGVQLSKQLMLMDRRIDWPPKIRKEFQEMKKGGEVCVSALVIETGGKTFNFGGAAQRVRQKFHF